MKSSSNTVFNGACWIKVGPGPRARTATQWKCGIEHYGMLPNKWSPNGDTKRLHHYLPLLVQFALRVLLPYRWQFPCQPESVHRSPAEHKNKDKPWSTLTQGSLHSTCLWHSTLLSQCEHSRPTPTGQYIYNTSTNNYYDGPLKMCIYNVLTCYRTWDVAQSTLKKTFAKKRDHVTRQRYLTYHTHTNVYMRGLSYTYTHTRNLKKTVEPVLAWGVAEICVQISLQKGQK